MKSNHKEIKDISTVKQEHVLESLEHRQDNGLSTLTTIKDMVALNKLFNLSITKKMANIKQRSYKDITRSRGPKAHDTRYNPDNYKDQIIVAMIKPF